MTVSSPSRRAGPGAPARTEPGAASPGPAPPGPSRSGTAAKVLYRVPDVMRLLSLSRSVIYNQIRTGRLRSVKQGGTRLIPADAITDYVALLEAEAEASR